MENNIIVNEKEITEEEFSKLKESMQTNKDIQLIEIAPNTYKTRLLG